jgi:peptide/nickel transport system substrate-binding protein
VQYAEASSGEQRTFNLINNTGDRDNVENPQIFTQSSKPRRSQTPTSTCASRLRHRLPASAQLLGLRCQTPRALALREMFRDLTFREALSYAVDRQGLATAAFAGPLTQPWYGGYPSASPFYDPNLVKPYEYSPDQAKALLGELGFTDTDGNGLVNWPEGTPVAGKTCSSNSSPERTYRQVSKQVRHSFPLFRASASTCAFGSARTYVLNLVNTSDFDMIVDRIDVPTPDVQPGLYGPATADEPAWHQAGPEGRTLLPFEEEMATLLEEAASPPTRRGASRSFTTSSGSRPKTSTPSGSTRRGAVGGQQAPQEHPRRPAHLPVRMGHGEHPVACLTAAEEQIAPRF